MLIAGCSSADGSVAGLEDIRVIPITDALTQQLASAPAQTRAPEGAAPQKLVKQAPAPYRIGAGDVVYIAVYGANETSGQELVRIFPTQNYTVAQADNQEVPQNGIIALPYVGEVNLLDKTAAELRTDLLKKYQRYFKNPQVEVKMAQFNASRVSVVGEVTKPGEQKLGYSDLTVLGALEAAGGATAEADLQQVRLTRKDGSIEQLDVQALLYNGDTRQNRALEAGDTLFVPTNHRNRIFLFGEVVKSESQTIPRGRLSLTEALNNASGLDKVTAARGQVYVLRGTQTAAAKPGAGKTEVTVYQLDASAPGAFVVADRFLLQPRDVVYVAEKPVTQWSRFMSQLLPSSATQLLYGELYVSNP